MLRSTSAKKTPYFAQPKQAAFLSKEELLFWHCHSSPIFRHGLGSARESHIGKFDLIPKPLKFMRSFM